MIWQLGGPGQMILASLGLSGWVCLVKPDEVQFFLPEEERHLMHKRSGLCPSSWKVTSTHGEFPK